MVLAAKVFDWVSFCGGGAYPFAGYFDLCSRYCLLCVQGGYWNEEEQLRRVETALELKLNYGHLGSAPFRNGRCDQRDLFVCQSAREGWCGEQIRSVKIEK